MKNPNLRSSLLSNAAILAHGIETHDESTCTLCDARKRIHALGRHVSLWSHVDIMRDELSKLREQLAQLAREDAKELPREELEARLIRRIQGNLW